jgi:hypothetical protein
MPTPHPPDDPGERLLDLLNGFAVSQIVCTAAQLELAEHLAAGPATLEQLAAATRAHAETLHRLLQACCLLGLARHDDTTGRYHATPLLELLGHDAPRSLSGVARLYGVEYFRAWSELLHTVRTGGSAFERSHGATLWSHLAADDQAAAAFAQAMTFNVRRHIPRILEAHDFSAAGTIVDVGAANGELLAAILSSYPSARGIAFDLPRVAERSGTVFEARGLAGRCQVVTGDFFEAVPAGGDLYLLKAVLHNWDDERAAWILRSCRAAMAPGARLLVIETPGPDPATGAAVRDELPLVMKDLWMMVLFGSRDRTAGEYVRLIEDAGFAEVGVVPGTANPALIQAIRRD